MHAPPERSQLEALFLRHRGVIERIAAALCRRHWVRGDDADDFVSTVELRLIENDYAILRKYRGEAALPTYLTVVIAALFREYRVKRWGRWRPSAAARRLGDVAVRLETLVHRDGLTLAQAAQVLRSSGTATMSDGELARLLAQLPTRAPLRPILDRRGPLPDDVAGTSRADAATDQSEADHHRRAVEEALRQALAQLSPEDQVIAYLKFWDGLGVADIARTLGLEQKPLYRRMDRLLGALRQTLEAAGLTRDDLRALLEDEEEAA